MKSPTACAFACVLFCTQTAWADVTMRSKMDYRMASYLPPAAAEAANRQMADVIANGVVVRIKGRRSVTSNGPLLIITDHDKDTVTLLDPKGKRYATSTLTEYGDKLKAAIPQMPPAARQMLDSIKIDVKSDKTGKTEVIKGIKSEEILVTMTMEMPGPMAAMGMTMEMHTWAATREELERVPALKELADYMIAQAEGTDPASAAFKMFGSLPGFGEKLKGPLQQVMKASSNAVLRTQMKMRMPASAQMMGAKDSNEPLMDLTTDLTELSTEPIADEVFQVPADYQSAPIENLIQLVSPVQPQVPRQDPPPAPAAAAVLGPPPSGVFRVGGDVTAPALLSKVQPGYTEEARGAGLEGTVLLYLQVNPEGKAVNIRVLRSLAPDLDRNAIAAVEQWVFRPGMKNGQAVTVEAQIEVNFRLLEKPDGKAQL